MSTPCAGPNPPRVQFGSPPVAVNPPGSYLRHRSLAERAYQARRRASRIRRAIFLLSAAVFYLVIGRELWHLARAKASLFSTQLRADTHGLTASVRKILRLTQRDASDAKHAEQAEALLGDASGLPLAADGSWYNPAVNDQ